MVHASVGRPFAAFWFLLTLAIMLPGAAFSAQVIDDLGHEISLQGPAKRIIPLYGAFAEILFALGAGKEILARTQADQFPPEIVNLPSVGTHMRPNVEMIIGLKPDLVVQSASRWEAAADMARVQDAGIPVAVFSPNTFNDIFSTMDRLAILVGRSGTGAGGGSAIAEAAGRGKGAIAAGERTSQGIF